MLLINAGSRVKLTINVDIPDGFLSGDMRTLTQFCNAAAHAEDIAFNSPEAGATSICASKNKHINDSPVPMKTGPQGLC